MDVRQSIHSEHAKTLDTQALRREFLIENIFVADEYTMVYSHIDRIIVGGIMPVSHSVEIGGEVGKQLGVSRLLDRRELGVINIGGAGAIIVDGQRHDICHRDALYIGKGAKELVFVSNEASRPAKFYYNCAPAHTAYPTKKVSPADVAPVTLGDNLPVTVAPSINTSYRMYWKPVSSVWDSPNWRPAIYGTPCHAIPMSAVWKFTSISIWKKTVAFSI